VKNFEKLYMDAVPGCCRLRTFEAHQDIMLCWSIAAQVRAEIKQTTCGMCEFNVEPAGDFARIEWETNRAKERMWSKIKGYNDYF
jgi:hypothetical protein